jgi:hypothetical protein
MIKKLAIGFTVFSLNMTAVWAQDYKTNNPNMGHFYMARQQVQIIDETPVVNDQRGEGAATGAGGGPVGAGGGAMPLPKSGFQSFYSGAPSNMKNSLPKVINGVPPKAPPPKTLPNGLRGASGKFPAKTAGTKTLPSGQNAAAKSYTPYQGYGGGNVPGSTVGSSGSSANTNVRGSVLHWHKKRGY